MHIDERKSVGQIAATQPELIPLFESAGIDYYCRGNRTLREACELVGLDLSDIASAAAGVKNEPGLAPWMIAPLTDLTNHLISHHHARTREILPRIRKAAAAVSEKYKATHPEVKRIALLFNSIADEMLGHLDGEEQMIFPQVEALEKAAEDNRPPEKPYIGGLSHRILVEYHEHDVVAEKVRKMREISSNYRVPDGAGADLADFYGALLQFEADLHQHMHLENNVLYPRAIDLENQLRHHETAGRPS